MISRHEFEELTIIAESLARSLGHSTKCNKLDVQCTCGADSEQAKALDDYQHWKKEYNPISEDKG